MGPLKSATMDESVSEILIFPDFITSDLAIKSVFDSAGYQRLINIGLLADVRSLIVLKPTRYLP